MPALDEDRPEASGKMEHWATKSMRGLKLKMLSAVAAEAQATASTCPHPSYSATASTCRRATRLIFLIEGLANANCIALASTSVIAKLKRFSSLPSKPGSSSVCTQRAHSQQ